MPAYEVKLIGREEVAARTMMFRFERPAALSFEPGQAVGVELLDPPAAPNSSRRTFSVVSAPFEPELAVATRMRDTSAFKRALRALPPAATIRLKGPFGDMTLHTDRSRPAILIAGGIGVTPFMSMVRQATHDRLARRLLLLYSNRRPEDAAFLAELQRLEQQNDGFRLLATMTDVNQSARACRGAQGMIDAAMVQRLVGDAARPVYYLAGPPAMVEGVKAILGRAGVTDENIRSEEFYGYRAAPSSLWLSRRTQPATSNGTARNATPGGRAAALPAASKGDMP